MIKLNKFLVFTLIFIMFTFCSCKKEGDVTQNKEVVFVNGVDEFDKETLYLVPSNPEALPKNSLNRKDTLIIGMPSPSGVFNPLFAISTNDVDVNDTMWDPILEIGGDGNVTNGIAYLPDIIESENTYNFIIRDDAVWQDGEPITSYDMEFTFKVLMDKTYTGTFERDNFDMVGWENYRDGVTEDIEGFKIIDDKRFSIKFNSINAKKNYYFERIKPLALHVYGKDYIQGEASKIELLNRKPFGNGPYKFVEYIEGEEVRLVANENYYNGEPKIKNLILRVINDSNQISLIENGDVDIVRKTILPTQENFTILNDMGFVGGILTDVLGYGYIAINHKEEIMQDRNIRQALAYGLDRESIVDSSFGDYGSVLNIPQNKNSYFYPDVESFTKYDYNPDKARKLLEESGWFLGDDGIREKNGKKLTLKFLASSPNEVNDILIPIMLDNYKKIGINVIVEYMESKTLIQRQKDAKEGKFSYHLSFMFTPFASPDPDSSSRFSTDGPSNRFSYSNERVDKLLNDALNELDNSKRKEIYAELYEELSYDLPYIFLFERKNIDVYTSKVKGIKNYNLNRWFSKDLEKLYFE
ncbi:ABC transporter, extracellular solute-binding protein [Candidatus Arthromitus sp. SFB-mouse-Japan]|uniref:ABC transporter substrate-binding protein n=1 Tax=unclassified Candidatus Neoarthromitus TaxID=2638829 RepID=UPI00021B7E9D|nr:ABC transporter substrate-binding protein [Candidatus Arthromitus sp. SFB-mouse]EIA22000.1 Extracellular solute-binding protein, family 5 [Candidatus Arthromitus sp. SFB-1]EIA25892.1 Extracellular solute-binding protein, family 5 [Candidatus Arthromitus sp. SFB-4]EIA26337.1 Extracellular solute-binding protein, family 5 [Candidatus Arthromitus sp. SFB-5]EIA27586.1 Extracellular solute-binding protein, family 5 [Candidatus Arthromitus sp. SFB-co]EIA30498.1 Extracellular solute-binding protei